MIIAELERFVCHVDFQAGDTFFAQAGEFGECGAGGVADEEVEGVVCVTVLFCFGVGGGEDGEEGGVDFALGCECDDGCCAAADCGFGAWGFC